MKVAGCLATAAVLTTLATLSVAADASLNFLMLGDWGGQGSPPYYTTAEKSVAAAMESKAREIGSQFVLALGDNFYDSGVTDVHDMRFQETFENIFTGESLQTPWYVVCGNHDHYGNASAQVAYTNLSKRWNMPNFYYTMTKSIPGDASVQFVMIDTVILAGLTDPVFRSIPPVLLQENVQQAEDQWSWIEDTLRQSTADWIIVAGHYPVWSVAEHGPTKVLVDRLRPMLEKYNVSAYFCGHDHDIQHIKENNSSVEYFVTGAAHHTDTSTAHESNIPQGSLKYRYGPLDLFYSKGGFNTVQMTKDTMTVTFFDVEDKKLYSTDIARIRNL